MKNKYLSNEQKEKLETAKNIIQRVYQEIDSNYYEEALLFTANDALENAIKKEQINKQHRIEL